MNLCNAMSEMLKPSLTRSIVSLETKMTCYSFMVNKKC